MPKPKTVDDAKPIKRYCLPFPVEVGLEAGEDITILSYPLTANSSNAALETASATGLTTFCLLYEKANLIIPGSFEL